MTPTLSRAPTPTLPRLRGRWFEFSHDHRTQRAADRIAERVDDDYLDRKGRQFIDDAIDAGADDAALLALARCLVAEVLCERLGEAGDVLAGMEEGRAEG